VLTGNLYEGYYWGGDWHYITIYSNSNAGASSASATLLNGTYYVAHLDSDRNLRLTSWSPFVGWTTMVLDGEGQSTNNNLGGDVAAVTFNGKLYVFYREWNYDGSKNRLRYAVFDGSHLTYQILDGQGGATNSLADLDAPAAVAAPDGLRVYYYDMDHGFLREAFSPDGLTWTSFATLDGQGGGGRVAGDVGHHPSAIVFNNTVNVFYEDRSNAQLRLAHLNGYWSFYSIDQMDFESYSAPVIHGGAMQVYYTANGLLRAAWGQGPLNFKTITFDGAGGALGQSMDLMRTPLAALEFNSAPSVFYQDGITGVLRNSWWEP